MKLEDSQQEKLALLFSEWLRGLKLPAPGSEQSETNYTGNVLLPLVEEWVKSLGKEFLVVRGDGGLPPLPLIVSGMSFFPDIEVAAQHDRYLGVEVKFLRTSSDATGSFSKALGQGQIYHALGIKSVHVLLLDTRQGVGPKDPVADTFVRAVSRHHLDVYWFMKESGGQLWCTE